MIYSESPLERQQRWKFQRANLQKPGRPPHKTSAFVGLLNDEFALVSLRSVGGLDGLAICFAVEAHIACITMKVTASGPRKNPMVFHSSCYSQDG